MSKAGSDERRQIHPEMTILEVICRYRPTEKVFRKYDKEAGACLCCQALFESLQDVAQRYGLDLERLLADLEIVADIGEPNV
jgi:hypothetical protein